MLNLFRSTLLGPLFEQVPIAAMDVGSRGGIEPDLHPMAWAVEAWGFEPDDQEFERLQGMDPGPWRALTHLPYALGARSEDRTLFVPRAAVGASLLEHDPRMGERFPYADLFTVERTLQVPTVSLDEVTSRHGIPPPAFLKLDVEGAELEILEGGADTLSHVLVVKSEVAFLEQRFGQPLAADIALHLRGEGFELMDLLSPIHWRKYSYVPAPYAGREPIRFSRGQIAQGDYLFFRDPETLGVEDEESLRQHVRLALIALCYGFFDYADAVLGRAQVAEFASDQLKGPVGPAIEQASRVYGRRVALVTGLGNLRQLYTLAKSLLNTFRPR
ncbi:FkbM family methyltransferase [Myxococcota bacterium]|nr:FkbM family methyltransferase [Myxococcota bacterium]